MGKYLLYELLFLLSLIALALVIYSGARAGILPSISDSVSPSVWSAADAGRMATLGEKIPSTVWPAGDTIWPAGDTVWPR